MAAGFWLLLTAAEIPIRLAWRKNRSRRRVRRFENIRSLDRQIRRMEKFLEYRRDTLEDEIDAETKLKS